MSNQSEIEQLYEIAIQIKKAGYEPYEQIYGYLQTGLAAYITRTGNAREKIQLISTNSIREFLNLIKK